MSNTLLKLYLTEKDFGCKKNDKDNWGIAGATNEVATLKEAVSKAENSAALERTEREKQEARVAEVRQELQAQRLESPSSPLLFRVPKPLRPKPRRPTRRSMQ